MNKLLAVLSAVLLLSACSTVKTVAVVDNEYFTMKLTDAACSVKPVLDNLNTQAQMAQAMGVPQDRIDEVMKSFKDGSVYVKSEKVDLKLCYRSTDNLQSAFVMDERGGEGVVILKAPKPQ